VIQVAHLADGGVAHLANQANFTGRQAQLRVIAFFGQQLRGGAGGANQLSALAFLQFDIVHHGADRNVGDGHAVAGANVDAGAGHDRVANAQPDGGHDVALFAVSIDQQG